MEFKALWTMRSSRELGREGGGPDLSSEARQHLENSEEEGEPTGGAERE